MGKILLMEDPRPGLRVGPEQDAGEELLGDLHRAQVDVLQQAQGLHLGVHVDAHVLDVGQLLIDRIVRDNEQILLLFLLLVSQLPGHDPGPEGVPPHLLVVDPDGEVDDLAPHVVLHSLGSPVVIGQRSPGAEVGHVALSEDVEPLAEGCMLAVSDL